MKKIVVNKGDRYGKLTILTELPKKSNSRIFQCKCVCGNTVECQLNNLRSGHTVSCGCNRINSGQSTHGLSNSKLYKVWNSMCQRCHNPNDKSYSRYGGRGIQVYSKWSEFISFYNWAIANGYQEGLELDRKNNDGHYSPDNCRWVTSKVNASNRRSNLIYTHSGIIDTLMGHCTRLGLNYGTVRRRLVDLNWPIEKALTI